MSNGPASDNQFGFKDEDGKCQACPQGQTCDGKTMPAGADLRWEDH